MILCVPVGAMGEAAKAIAPRSAPGAVVSDVGSSKLAIGLALAEALPDHCVIPAHPVAGTEHSGPDAGFATLFQQRWCIVTPRTCNDPAKVAALVAFWQALGAMVDTMDPEHHDLVLAVTSHIPHLIAYTIVGTASDLEEVTRGEVIKYSAGGFRDFTRIAASDPTMWRDVFLNNREAVLEMLDRFLDRPRDDARGDPRQRRRDDVRLVHPHPRDPPLDRRARPGRRAAGLRAQGSRVRSLPAPSTIGFASCPLPERGGSVALSLLPACGECPPRRAEGLSRSTNSAR